MAVQIQSFQRVIPMIYAYQTPGIPYHKGWTKIGYTEKQDVRKRIEQQTHTAGIHWELCWMDNAMYKDGSGQYFTDHEFHDYLECVKKISRKPGTEWFQIDGDDSQILFQKFASCRAEPPVDGSTYQLRREQQEAVAKTKAYFASGGTEFLWNAKPRFGKTLSAYDLVVQMGFTNVLIVTNRPSISNSWADDFRKFIGWQHKLAFVSDTDALKGKPGVLSRNEFIDTADQYEGMVAFESLQGLKGSAYFGGEYDKLKWMAKEVRDASGKVQRGITFDLLIIDESHEGVDTAKTDRAFRNIGRKHTLYLSGTPFRALAGGRFSENQIYNWSYADEQEAKEMWAGEGYNPYEALPSLSMYTYQLGTMIYEQVRKGLDLSVEDGSVDYAFDLNEFFATNDSGRFVHEEEIRKFLHALSTQEKYPFSTPELRAELSHTLWILNRVASAKALAKLLKTDPVFAAYEVVLAAGDGQLNDDVETNDKAFDRVKDAIAKHDKTITLSVGQLTVGVTIPEWSGVLMLCNLQSPSSYMQAAFRAQNPCILTRHGQRYRKETAYVFDFDPARTLIIFDEFANNLSPDMTAGKGTSEERRQNIKRLLNFFPVLGEDEEGRMVELDAAQVLSIPRKLKSAEVVRRGFMSNFLFQNIGAVFGAPSIVTEIDEVVFNDSVNEFWQKKQELANYFDENSEEDIFDYIPPQKTNQIFTPRWVVQKMVDELEAENPGCFDDPDLTFADLYMKSGLYITEIIKRLYRSRRMKEYFPNDEDRIRHILTKQVYGMAPTRIIYLISTNYILGFDDRMRVETKNFVQADAAEAAKAGTLEQLVHQHFG